MQSSACQRARFIAALALDDEPSELDARALAQHLVRCPACRAFVQTVESFTRELRDAELEVVPVHWSVGRRRRGVDSLIRRSVAGAVVASVAALGGAAFTVAGFEAFGPRSDVPRVLPALVIDASGADASRETQRFLRGLRDASLARTLGISQRGAPERPGMQAG
jgi:hypothetical protein